MFKKIIISILGKFGLEVKRINSKPFSPPIGSEYRPVGNMQMLLEDLKLRGLRCKNILDIGANNTAYSRMFQEIFPEAGFCLVEPQIEMKGHLEQFCEEVPNSNYFLAGAGVRNEKKVLTIWDDLAGSTFILPADEALLKNGKQREIEIISINDLIETGKIKLPEFVKLDIQGYELEALKGASKTFGYTEVYIMEVSLFPYNGAPEIPVISDVINFMLDRDYVIYDFPGFLRRPLDGALAQCDICFVKRNGFLKASNSWSKKS